MQSPQLATWFLAVIGRFLSGGLIEFQQLLVRLSFNSRSLASCTLPEYENNGRSISELLSYKSIETYNL